MIARVTVEYADSGAQQVTEDSTVTIFNGDEVVAHGQVPVWVAHGGRMGSARVLRTLEALGYNAINYFDGQRRFQGGFEVDVEPLP